MSLYLKARAKLPGFRTLRKYYRRCFKQFYGQAGEDKEVYNTFFRNHKVKNGYFVELGALDGELCSNSKFFEDSFGWTGVLIEPIQDQFERLKINRPKCTNFNCAVSSKEGVMEFIGNGLTAGLKQTMAPSFKKHWHSDNNDYYNVPALTISKILNMAGTKYIDFFSIDVEGGELEVLKSFDFKIPVHVILIELDGHNEKKDYECRKILKNNGMKFVKRVWISDIWVNENYKGSVG